MPRSGLIQNPLYIKPPYIHHPMYTKFHLVSTTLLLIILSCNSHQERASDQDESIYSSPQTFPVNLNGGHVIHPISGDSIRPFVNAYGDTVITGSPIEINSIYHHPDSFGNPIITQTTSLDQLESKNAYPNRIHIEKPNKIKVNKDSLGTYSFDFELLTQINAKGDTVISGEPIPVSGKIVDVTHPQRTVAQPLKMKVNASAGIRYLDQEQGLSSTYIIDMEQDSIGNIWIATWGGGISKYDGNSFWHYSNENGLVGNNVRGIKKDIHGNLWMATWGDGICKFDGKSFTHFTENEGLLSGTVWTLLPDSKGNIWFASAFYGVTKYDGTTFSHFTTKEGLGSPHVRAIYEDHDGTMWFGSMNGGLAKLENDHLITYMTASSGLLSDDVRSIFRDSKGNLWLGTTGGLCVYDGEIITQYPISINESFMNIQDIEEDEHGNIWFASEKNGLLQYNGTYFTHYGKAEGLTDIEIWALLKDDAGNIWMGTNGGINHIYPNSFKQFSEEQGVANNVIWTINEDANGRIWCGTTGFGASVFSEDRFRTITVADGLPGSKITTINQDKRGNLWFGSAKGGTSKYDGTTFTKFDKTCGFTNNTVWDILEDKNGDYWFCIDGLGLYRYDGEAFTIYNEESGFSSNYLYTIIEDSNQELWIGTWGGGVAHYDFEKFTYYTEAEGLISNNICAIHEDKGGNLWFVSDDAGVMCFDRSNLTYYTTEQGLTTNTTAGIFEDEAQNIWITSTSGINLLKNEGNGKYNVIQLTKNDGLMSMSYLTGSTVFDSQNRIWMGSGKGIIRLDSGHTKTRMIIPRVQLNEIHINELQYNFSKSQSEDTLGFSFDSAPAFYNYPQNLKLNHDYNHLTFHYSAIDWSGPHKLKYSHQIEGLSQGWSLPSSETKAEYRNIPPGEYTFMVKATNESGEWSEPLTYIFSITPPWWETTTAKIVYLLLLISFIYLIVRLRTAKLKKRQEELEYEIEIATAEIREQHEEIMDSISYAKRIQNAILPPDRIVKEYLSDSFILYKPKDIVAGDFYWMEHKNGKVLFAAADCTGHGVPGAMVSVICNNALNRSVKEYDIDEPGKILDKAREIVIQEFEKSDEEVKDGMDIALCSLNGMELEYAGAHNPIWIIRNGELIETKANKQPIGKFFNPEPYTTHKFTLEQGDTFYIFSDGYADQFGGEKGKKFKAKAFKQLLLDVQEKSMQEQKQIIDDSFEKWKGSIEQIDDVCIIGVRV